MSVTFIEGFEHLANTQLFDKGWENAGGAPLATYWAFTTGRLGSGQALQLQNQHGSSSVAWRRLPHEHTSIIVGMGLQWSGYTSLQSGWYPLTLRSYAGTNVVRLIFYDTGPKWVYRLINSAGTTLATGTTSITIGSWHYIELKVVVGTSTGSVELRVDGSSTAECSASGLNLGTAGIGHMYLASPSQDFTTLYGRFDDIYVVDASGSDAPRNTFLGECRVETLRPASNGAYAQFTPSAGSNWENVDDSTSHDGDSTYNSSSTIGHIDTFVMSEPAGTYGDVLAVQTSTMHRKSAAGYRRLAPVLRYDGTDNVGSDYAPLVAGYMTGMTVYQTTPLGAEWSAAAIMLSEFGYKVTG